MHIDILISVSNYIGSQGPGRGPGIFGKGQNGPKAQAPRPRGLNTWGKNLGEHVGIAE